MNILGINGWHTRNHDASACLVKNGKISAMAEEERFIREKYAFDKIPINAIGYCLDRSNISPNEVDMVAFGWDYKWMYSLRQKNFDYTSTQLLDIIFPKRIFRYDKKPKLVIVPHHIAHAASVFFTSGFKEAAILVIDGQGEESSTSVAYGINKNIKFIKSFPIKNSLGYFYESVNKYIGFSHLDSGKTMGLSPYGKSIFNFKNIELTSYGYDVNLSGKLKYSPERFDEQEVVIDMWQKKVKKLVGRPNTVKYRFEKDKRKIVRDVKIGKVYKDLAASAQTTLEKTVYHLANFALEKTDSSNLCISGGVGLNCVANGKLLKNPLIDSLYIFPATNDAGVSAGAALYASICHEKNAKPTKIKHAYLGPEYTSNQIKKILDEKKIKYKKSMDTCKEVSHLLAKNKIVGWFQGRMEIGPRALGNRSILASPMKKSTWNNVNQVKGRETWRPLAPSILEEYIDDYFENAQISPFMLKAFQVKKDKYSRIPAVVHVDGSTRPQTVSRKTNKKYWILINEFRKITNIPVVLNTSFNGPGEPIVCSPQDAIAMFYNSGLDCLVLNDFIIKKDNG